MYANLKVRYEGGKGEVIEVMAWRIVKLTKARVRIYTDEHDGEGSYAQPGPELDILAERLRSVEADF